MKHRVMKIILYVSLIPILFCIITGIVAIFNGYGYATMSGDLPNKVYGFKAFWESFLSMLFALSIIGVIPACMLYQIIYIFVDVKDKED